MMRVSAVAVMKKLAEKNFKLGEVRFKDFEKIDVEETSMEKAGEGLEDYGADIEVWANMVVGYEGDPPESYRVLNGMIQDWVDDHDDDLKKIINPKLISFLKDQFKDIDTSDLNEAFDDYVWEDQVDYMPEIDEDKKEIEFTLEMVLEVDQTDEDE